MIPNPSDLRIYLLGGLRIVVGGQSVDSRGLRRRKARGLLALLALAPRHALQREELSDALWPDVDPEHAARNLRLALHVARRALDQGAPGQASHLESRDQQIALRSSGALWVDVDAFEQAAAQTRRTAEPVRYQAAIALYAGDLLPEDRYEDWAASPRERLRETYVALLLELATLLEERADYGGASEALQRLTHAEPANEVAGAALMRVYARSGRRRQALRQYELLRGALRDDLDVAPDRETERLHAEILAGLPLPAIAGEPDSPATHPAEQRHNLRAPLTSFVGREAEVAAARKALGVARLVTLTGPGGGGKTRLAEQVAASVLDGEFEGVYLISLSTLSSAETLPAAIANTLNITLDPALDATAALAAALGERRLLLVLDNCEHLIDGCARLAQRLLEDCPALTVLATSREPLGVPGEIVLRVPSLSVPEPAQPLSLDEVSATEGVRLFLDRAAAVEPAFELTLGNVGSVSEIVRRLDGLPLAIELAAARVPLLGVAELARRLDDALRVLRGTSRVAPPRHQTLRATLDWSYDLLDAREQLLFQRLAVFNGGWTLEAAETICGGEGIESDDVLDLLARLAHKSLAVVEAGERGVRYRLLEVIRQYAAERLAASGEAEVVSRQHAAHYLTLAEAARPELNGARQAEWLALLEREHDNFRAALRWSAELAATEIEPRLCAALWLFWYYRGHLLEGEQALAAALQRGPAADALPGLRAKLLHGLGALVWNRGDLTHSAELSREAQALYEQVEDWAGVAATHHNLGLVAEFQGDIERATRHYSEELRLRDRLGDKAGAAGALQGLGNLARDQRDFAHAFALHESSLALQRELGNKRGIGVSLSALGVIALDEGNYVQAAALQSASLEMFQELGEKSLCAIAFHNLGYAVMYQGDHARAAALQAECLRLSAETGDRRGSVYGLEGVAGTVALSATAAPAARAAARLYGAVDALRQELGLPLSDVDRAFTEPPLAAARAILGETGWQAAWLLGRALPLDDAVAAALVAAEAVQPAAPAHPDASPAPHLSRREREVAVQLALGRTNAQIAATLNMAERTADTHVSNILRKLTLTSRTEVRAWAIEQGLLDA